MTSVDRVKQICKERGIAIYKLEKDCGFANGYIGQLKKGTLPDDRLYKVAAYLNVSPQYLLRGESADDGTDLIEELQILRDHPHTRSLLHASKRLTPEQVRKMTEMILSMQEEQ